MAFRLLGFLGTMTLILSAAMAYTSCRALSLWPWAGRHSRWIWGGAALFLIIELGGQIVQRALPTGPFKLALQWIVYTGLGVFATFFFYLLIVDLMWLPLRWFWSFSARFKSGVFFAVVAATVLSVGIGTFQALIFPKVKKVRISIPELPSGLEGFRIAQISDLHLGGLKPAAFTEELVASVNSLKADIIVLTGDMVDGTPAQLQKESEPFKKLDAPHGVYFVTGNHEYYSGATEWVERFRSMKIVPLMNEHTKLSVGNGLVILAGVTDRSAGQFNAEQRSDARKALLNEVSSKKADENQVSPLNAVKILLAHQPATYQQALENNFDLMLSGHTHAGQFFPWKLVVGLAYPYFSGLNKNGRLWIYTNAGTGFWGPPNRFTVPGEISLIVLSK